MTHTPRPWKVIETWRFDHKGNQQDALIIVNDETNGDVLSGKNAKANAQLLSAAPALLEALKGIYEDGLVIDALSLVGLEDVLDTAGSAIRKAEGGE